MHVHAHGGVVVHSVVVEAYSPMDFSCSGHLAFLSVSPQFNMRIDMHIHVRNQPQWQVPSPHPTTLGPQDRRANTPRGWEFTG